MKDGKVKVDGANVVKTDIACSNGVIHVIDSVILPADKDIVDTAVAAGSFKTLAAALTAAGLVETLKGEGPFTVFAPTDEAFAKLPAGHCGKSAEAREQGKADRCADLPRRVRQSAGERRREVKISKDGQWQRSQDQGQR